MHKPSLWKSADTYERYMGRWSRRLAPLFLEWLDADSGKRWIDVGCGTGILSAQIAASCAPSHLTGIDTSEVFLSQAEDSVPDADLRLGDATSLELPDDAADFSVSGLVLNFVPDKEKMLGEMVRVVRPGGIVALYVWDYAGQMQIMRYFFDTAREFDPESSNYDDGIRAPICRPGPLARAFGSAGLKDVQTTNIDIPTAFSNFDDYWTPFLGGTGSAPKYCASIDGELLNRIRDAVRAKLPTGPDGEILLAARAWAVRGVVPD